MSSIPPTDLRVVVLPGPELATRPLLRSALGSLDGVWFASQCLDVILALQDGAQPLAIVAHLDTVGCLKMIQRIRSHETWRAIPIFALAGTDAMAVIRAIQAGARTSFSSPYKGLAAPLARVTGSPPSPTSPRRATPARGLRRSG